MKRQLVMLMLFFILISGTVVCIKARINGCQNSEGVCRKTGFKHCKRLYQKCPTGRICCKKGSRGKKEDKRKNTCDDRVCKGLGGVCLPNAGKDTACGVRVNIPKICLGKKCACCLRDKPGCGIKSSCRLGGGICVKGSRKYFDNKNLLGNGCSSDGCHCYISEDKCDCGIAKKTRVIGGKEVSVPNKYPWLVGIRKRANRKYVCGGTIINSRYIVTAAHCLRTGKKFVPAKTLLIGVADHNYQSKEDDIKGVTKHVRVQKIVGHPKYRDDFAGYDIALIRLKKELDFGSQIAPACLPTGNRAYAKWKAVALGWGAVNTNNFLSSSFAREVDLPILNQTCNGIAVSGVKITSIMLCAGGEEGKDTCAGDSGGPLLVKEEGRYTLVGITSFGSGCAEKGMPAVYTRVSEFREWIVKNTKDGEYCS